MMKRILSALLAAIFCFSLSAGVFAADMSFTDVKPGDWFYDDVKTAVASGLVNGKSSTVYAPDDNLSYAEAIKLAACMNQLYHDGAVTLKNGNPWYQSYVDYCIAHKIIDREYNYSDSATRAGYINIFAKAIPDEGLQAINRVPDNSIPDVSSSQSYAASVYKLYRAGILRGVDEAHHCNPYDNIKRSEVAAILTRMMNAEKRISFDMGKDGEIVPTVDPLAMKTQPQNMSIHVGEWAAFSVEATGGNAPYSYQWQVKDKLNWRDIVDNFDLRHQTGNRYGAKTAQLLLRGVSAGSNDVRCVITDASGQTIESGAARFVVEEAIETTPVSEPLTVKKQPESMSIRVDQWASFTVEAAGGSAPYSYQWQLKDKLGWRDIVDNFDLRHQTGNRYGAKMAQLLLRGVSAGSNVVRCVITDAAGQTVESTPVMLTVEKAPETKPLEITLQPKNVCVEAGEMATLEVSVANGTAPYSYRWQSSSDGGSSFSDVLSTDGYNGYNVYCMEFVVRLEHYQLLYRCVITDAAGNTVTSDAVGVYDGLTIISQPTDVSCGATEAASFSVTAFGGTMPYTYQWQVRTPDSRKYENINGLRLFAKIDANSQTLCFDSVTKLYSGISLRCVVTDAAGTVITSQSATLTVK